ncbi:MAG TPA: fibronectin type III domain-containing protein [Arcobacter sp.]|nr:fibronectin type III domain-containing protein [Arcobacter sp.]
MFNYTKRLFISLLLTFGIFTFFVEATVPNPPLAYLGITKLDESNTSIRVSFMNHSDNEDKFYVYFYPKDSSILAVFPPAIPNIEMIESNGYFYANIKNLDCNTTYKVFVLGKHEDRYYYATDSERTFNIKTTFNATCPISKTILAPKPYIGVTDINETAVRINFFDNSDNETGFRIFGNDINITLPPNDETENPTVSANIPNLICNKTYQIQIVAFDDDGESTPTEKRAFNIHTTFDINCPSEVPNAPGPYIGVYNVKETTARISFKDNSNNETSFKVYDSNDTEMPVEEGTILSNDETQPRNLYQYANLIDLEPCKVYKIKVVAVNNEGVSLPSDIRTFKTTCSNGLNIIDTYTKIKQKAMENRQITKDDKTKFVIRDKALNAIDRTTNTLLDSLDLKQLIIDGINNEGYYISGVALSNDDKKLYIGYSVFLEDYVDIYGGVLVIDVSNPSNIRKEGSLFNVNNRNISSVMVAKDDTVYAMSTCSWAPFSKRCRIGDLSKLYSTNYGTLSFIGGYGFRLYQITDNLIFLHSASDSTAILIDTLSGRMIKKVTLWEYVNPTITGLTLDESKVIIHYPDFAYPNSNKIIQLEPNVNYDYQKTLSIGDTFISNDGTEALTIDGNKTLQYKILVP